MSIGDNEIDIIGEYSGYAIKLPNEKKITRKKFWIIWLSINLIE